MQTQLKSYHTDLSDTQWQRISALIPKASRRGRPLEHSRRSIVNALFYLVRAGCAWRLLPKNFAPWQTVYGYYRRWARSGL